MKVGEEASQQKALVLVSLGFRGWPPTQLSRELCYVKSILPFLTSLPWYRALKHRTIFMGVSGKLATPGLRPVFWCLNYGHHNWKSILVRKEQNESQSCLLWRIILLYVHTSVSLALSGQRATWGTDFMIHDQNLPFSNSMTAETGSLPSKHVWHTQLL